MRLDINKFIGTRPAFASDKLPEENAVLAKNCRLTDGSLRAYRQSSSVHTLPEPVSSIYLYHNENHSHWFTFDADVDVVNSPINDDPNNRVYLSGTKDGARWTDSSLALSGGSEYPVNSRRLGLPPPNVTPVASLVGSSDTDAVDKETRLYVTTWVDEYGRESSPSLPSNAVNWGSGQTVSLSVDGSPANGDAGIVAFRVYVTRGDGLWWLCEKVDYSGTVSTDVPLGNTAVTDVTPITERASNLKTVGWDAPPQDVKDFTVLPNGVIVGFRGHDVLFSEPFHPYAFPSGYSVSCESPIVALSSAGNSVIVATTGFPYVVFGTEPSAMTQEKIDIAQACVSKRSMVDAGYSAFYASPDGLVEIKSNGGSRLATDGVINAQEWRSRYHPETLQGYWHDNKYFGFYDGGGFIFDPVSGALVDLDGDVHCAYVDLRSDALYLQRESEIFEWDKGTELTPYQWRSRLFRTTPIKITSARVTADSYDNLTFRFYEAGTLVMEMPVTSSRGFRLPMGRFEEWQIEIAGTDTVRGVTVASSMGEL